MRNGKLIPAILVLLLFSCSNPSDSGPLPPYKWETAIPEEQGLDSEKLIGAVSFAQFRGFINSLLIIKNGFLVSENYFNGYDIESPHSVQSVSKSFLSALIGIALRENLIPDLDRKIIEYFPEYTSNVADSRMNDITLKNLLMMRGGIESDRNLLFPVIQTSDWIQTIMETELALDPGEKFYYSTMGTHIISAMLSRVTGISNLKFANNYLFKPMKISIKEWEMDPKNNYTGGFGMYFTARDMARFGFLYMQNGYLDGKQIVPRNWVEESVRDHLNAENFIWGAIEDIGYGYLWWTGKIGEYPIYFALGHGGQFIMNFDEQNMIVVVTSNSEVDWDLADAQEQSVTQLIRNYVLPAIKKTGN